jgi:hypothetical protein
MRFRALSEAGVKRWSRPRRLDFLDRLPTAPLAESELLHMAHYCPVVILAAPDGPRVALLLDPTLSRSDPIGNDGRWRMPYCPMALRCLPFWPGHDATAVEIAIEIALQQPEVGLPVYDSDGRPSPPFAAVLTLIERLRSGMDRLSRAAAMLVAGDLLAPLVREAQDGSAPVDTGYLTVDPDRLHALSPFRLASLSVDQCLPMELATACLFSRRLLRPRVRIAGAGLQGPARAEDPVPSEALGLDARAIVDASPLFSFDLFERLEAQAHAAA